MNPLPVGKHTHRATYMYAHFTVATLPSIFGLGVWQVEMVTITSLTI